MDQAQARAEGEADVKSFTERRWALGQPLKRRQSLLKKRDRLANGRARHCLLSCLAQVPRRPLPHFSAHRMVSQALHVFG